MPFELAELLRRRIRERGPLSFRDYMEEVLYHPRFGYYASDRSPIGRQGDFYTSADVDPIFGQLLASRFDRMARGLDSFTLVELGAGNGLLAKHILEQRPTPYIILERSPSLRRRQQELLKGFDVQWVDDLPQGLRGCIFSNEFFDALPVHRIVRRGGELREIYVTEQFQEIEGELQAPLEDCLDQMKEGQIADVSLESRSWMKRIGESLQCGYHLAIDYGYLRDQFYAHPYGTLMCYWQHQAGENPYIRVGEQDITAHVNFSDLIDAGAAAGLSVLTFKNQMDFLVDEGILDEFQRLAVSGDAASMQRLLLIKRLILPGNMGERFKVLIQSKGICRTSQQQPTPSPQPGRN